MVPELTGNYRQIASYVVNNPEDIIKYKVRQLADRCECDDAQIVRFCQKVGFSGIQELRSALAKDFIPAKFRADFRQSEAGDSFAKIREDFLQNNLRALHDTLALLDPSVIDRAVGQINSAGRILLCGLGASGLVAQDFQIKLFRMGYPAHFSPDSELNRLYCGLLKANDLLIAISFSGENGNVRQYAEAAKGNGASVLAITNFPLSPIGALADLLLQTASDEAVFRLGAMSSRISQLLLVDFLALQLALRDTGAIENNIIRTHQTRFPEDGPETAHETPESGGDEA